MKGETIGLIGESGSGKTTLINLLLGFLEPKKGNIIVDGVQMNRQMIPSWRSIIGYVKQDAFLLDDTMERNIAFGRETIDHKKMGEILEAASLKSYVDNLTDGLQTFVGDKGTKLSGGQRQRIGIARALYNGVSILVFDEATSSLDNNTEKDITESIKGLRKRGYTIIIVAHRYSTLKYCDKILELKEGKVVKETNYSEIANE